MRVTRVALLLLLLPPAASARAQDAPHETHSWAGRPPAEPATWFVLAGRARLLRAPGVWGADGAFGAHAAWSPHPALEVGGGLDVRAAHVAAVGADRQAGRAGAGLLCAWAGTGHAWRSLSAGLRLSAAAGSRAVGASGLDGGAPEGRVDLEAAVSMRAREGELAVAASVGGIWDGVATPVAAVGIAAALVDGGSRLRPTVHIDVAHARGLRPALEAGVGFVFRLLPGWWLTGTVDVALPGDPAGRLAGLDVGLAWLP